VAAHPAGSSGGFRDPARMDEGGAVVFTRSCIFLMDNHSLRKYEGRCTKDSAARGQVRAIEIDGKWYVGVGSGSKTAGAQVRPWAGWNSRLIRSQVSRSVGVACLARSGVCLSLAPRI
jgi:hypothetical protein